MNKKNNINIIVKTASIAIIIVATILIIISVKQICESENKNGKSTNILFEKEVILGGQVVSIIDGMYVMSISEPTIELRLGDIIIKVNGKAFSNISEYQELLESIENVAYINYIRNNSLCMTKIEKKYLTGVSVTNNILGSFICTFYDIENNKFVGCGHEINTITNNATIYFATVENINWGYKGWIDTNVTDIKIAKNLYQNSCGVYGNIEHIDLLEQKAKIKISKSSLVHKGEASIYCCLDNREIKEYKIKITKLNFTLPGSNTKHFKFKIIDDELIKKTGGVIRGMSGTPIVQDGKLIGAISHAMVNDYLKGYATYIELMN